MSDPAQHVLPGDDTLEQLAAHDHSVTADREACEAAARVAEEVRVLVSYAIVEGDPEELERLSERLGTPGMAEALRIARERAGR